MTTTVQHQVLINARALIADPSKWTTGTLACDAEGHSVAWHDGSARKWCAQGAIYRAAYDLVGDQKKAVSIGPRQRHERPGRGACGFRQSLAGGLVQPKPRIVWNKASGIDGGKPMKTACLLYRVVLERVG